MKEAVGRLKREADFALPRTCKRPRSSVVYSKNSNWEYTHQPRRSSATPEGLQSFLKAAAKPQEQEEEDLDEIAMALLEMSSPIQKGVLEPSKATASPSSNGNHTRPRRASFPTAAACNAWQLKSNALKAVPKIIITSGSSTDTGPTELKSNSSDIIDAVNSTGQTGSPSSNQDSETVAYMLPRQSDRPAGIQRSQTCSLVADANTQNPRQPLILSAANSLPNPVDGAQPPLKMGHTVSTGISLPRISQQANKQVKQEAAPPAEAAGLSHAQLKPCNRVPSPDAQTQAMLQQILHARLAGKSQPGRPIANSRGGKLIVLPDPPPKGPNADPTESKQANLPRVPTLVLSNGQKPSSSRAVSPGLPITSNPAKPAIKSGGSMPPAQLQKVVIPRASQAAPQPYAVSSGMLCSLVSGIAKPDFGVADIAQKGHNASKEGTVNKTKSTSSSEESSEDDWMPSWSLSLYNALNPSVITTGHLTGKTTIQAFEAKAANIAR